MEAGGGAQERGGGVRSEGERARLWALRRGVAGWARGRREGAAATRDGGVEATAGGGLEAWADGGGAWRSEVVAVESCAVAGTSEGWAGSGAAGS